MKRWVVLLSLLIFSFCLSACGAPSSQTEENTEPAADTTESESRAETAPPRIRVEDENGNVVVFELNDSPAATDLYRQLPLTVAVEDYSTNEKIFYPEALDVTDTPTANTGIGTLAYYAPWGDVVMFYDSFGANGSLYELGEVVSGEELISGMSGTVTVEAAQ